MKFQTPLISPVQGVSQADPQLRPPEYVDEMINLIPDVNKGLYTRPGTKHVMSVTNALVDPSDGVLTFGLELDGEDYALVINTSQRFIKLYNLARTEFVETFDTTLIQDYLADIDDYDDVKVVVDRKTIYILNKTKKLTLEAFTSSVTITANSAYQYPPKMTLHVVYIDRNNNTVDKTGSMDLATFKSYLEGKNPAESLEDYDRTSSADTAGMATLIHDMLSHLIETLALTEVKPNTAPLSLTLSNNQVTLQGEPGVVFSFATVEDPWIKNSYLTTNATFNHPPLTTSLTEFKNNLDKMLKIQIESYYPDTLYASVRRSNYDVNAVGTATGVLANDITIKDGTYVVGYVESRVYDSGTGHYIHTMYLHPYYDLWAIYLNYGYNTVIVTYNYKGTQYTTNALSINSDTNPVASIASGDLPSPQTLSQSLKHAPVQISMLTEGYIVGFEGTITNVSQNAGNDAQFIRAKIDPQTTGRSWSSAIDRANNLYSNITSVNWSPDLPSNFDVAINGATVTLTIPYNYEWDLNVLTETTDFELAYAVIGNSQSTDETATPLRVYNNGASWIAEHLPFTFTYQTTLDLESNLGQLPLEQLLGNPIQDILVYQNRFIMLTERGLIASKINDFTQYSPDDPLNLTDADPIDITFAQPGDKLKYIKPFSDSLVVFGQNHQYSVFHSGIFSLLNLQVLPATSYSIEPVEPVTAGAEIYFLTQSPASSTAKYYAVKRFLVQPNTQIKAAYGVSDHIPTYINKTIGKLIYLTQADYLILVPTTANNKTLFVLKNTYQGNNQVQQAWFKWEFKRNIRGVIPGGNNNQLYLFVDTATPSTTLNIIKLDELVLNFFGADIQIKDEYEDNNPANAVSIDIYAETVIPDVLFKNEHGSLTSYVVLNGIHLHLLEQNDFKATLITTRGSGSKDVLTPDSSVAYINYYANSEDIFSSNAKITIDNSTSNNNRIHMAGYTLEGKVYPRRRWGVKHI